MADLETLIHAPNAKLDVPLAATLAGPSFAAAAILLAARESVSTQHRIIKGNGGQVLQADLNHLEAVRGAGKQAVTAVYFFMIFLVSELAGEHSRAGVVAESITVSDGATLLVSTSAGGAGLILLFRAAQAMKRLY